VIRDAREREWRSWSIVDSSRRRSRSVADGRMGRGSMVVRTVRWEQDPAGVIAGKSTVLRDGRKVNKGNKRSEG